MHQATAGTSVDAGPGCIVLAAYRPDEDLLARQLESIRAQTVRTFRCLIVADGGEDAVRAAVRRIVGDDPRFAVIGAAERLGFYLNFERGLAAVPVEASWIALSDQDDFWYPDKLARMLPHLREVAMVSAQARVVRHPSGEVVAATTGRRDVAAAYQPVFNQFTGGMSVLRRDVLDVALPFPRFASPAEVHDHWLALSAALSGGARVIDDVVQDYVQHGANVLGEAADDRTRPLQSWRALRRRAEGTTVGPVRSLATAAYVVSAGWAEAMVGAVVDRPGVDRSLAERLARVYGGRGSWWRGLGALARAVAGGRVPPRNALVYLIGRAARPLVPSASRP